MDAAGRKLSTTCGYTSLVSSMRIQASALIVGRLRGGRQACIGIEVIMLRRGVLFLVFGLLGVGVGISLERVYSMTIVALLVGVYGELLTVVGIGMIVVALWKKRPSHEN